MKLQSPGMCAQGFAMAADRFPELPRSLQRLSIQLEPDIGVRIRPGNSSRIVVGVPEGRARPEAAARIELASAANPAGNKMGVVVRGAVHVGQRGSLPVERNDVAGAEARIIRLSERRS